MGKYQIIYADPPWSYRSGKVNGAAQNHYPTMSDEQLYQLPVSTLAADTCVLFLWCTFPKLPEALKLIKAWGFTFKTVAFVCPYGIIRTNGKTQCFQGFQRLSLPIQFLFQP